MTHARARRIVGVRSPRIGDPDVAITVHMDPMGEEKQPAAHAGDHVALRIDLEDRIEIGPGAGVGAASVDRPDVPAVGIDVDARR